MKFTNTISLDSDALLVLVLERVPEEPDCKIHSRCEHAISDLGVRSWIRKVTGRTDCDSVRKTGSVFVSVKFCRLYISGDGGIKG